MNPANVFPLEKRGHERFVPGQLTTHVMPTADGSTSRAQLQIS